jgi:hypothetical protein
MGRKYVSLESAAAVKALHETGMKLIAICNQTKLTYSVVQRIVAKIKNGHALGARAKPGRPRITTKHQDRKIVRESCKDPFSGSKEAASAAGVTGISKQTIIRRLREAGLRNHTACRKPLLTNLQKRRRKSWAKQWGTFDFSRTIFSDEKRFCFRPDGRLKVWRKQGARYQSKYMQRMVQQGGGGIMVWGAITMEKADKLVLLEGKVNSDQYIKTLKEYFGPPKSRTAIFKNRCKLDFQQDNAPVHTSAKTEEFLKKLGVTVLPWPARSPDLSPIENVWGLMQSRLRRRTFTSKEVLWEAVQAEWRKISPEYLKSLYDSMPNRTRMVKTMKGDAIRY